LLYWIAGLCWSAVAAIMPAAADARPAGAGVAAPELGLIELMERRLELMPQVAAYKWHNRQPVQDPAREAVVVAEARTEALRHGLVPETVERLFVVQMEAARAVQSWWLDAWAAGRAEPPPAPDLAGAVRPALSALGGQIVAAAAETARAPWVAGRVPGSAPEPGLPFAVPGLDDGQRRALLDAVTGLAVYPDRLAQILATGRLRIGTTGDYAPFSHREDGAAEFVGIDIDLGHDLAAALGVEPEFVLTSWPDLVDDLQAGRFDIAMSGVSRTLVRQRVGFQTAPYYADGKTPIARCAEQARFDTLEEIDRAGIRVVVNPGGTNERFVDERIGQAQKVLHPDNRTIFAELLAGRADVMFTDRIEVELQSRRHPELCGTMAADLTYQEKAYLLPQDPAWLEFVDTWLALRLAEGAVDAAFAARGFERRPPR
jgi:cyclohexadienyl dehydratase